MTEWLHFICKIGEGNGSTLAWKIPWAYKAAVHGVAKSWTRLSNFTFTFYFHALKKEMATHSSILAWRIPGRGGAWWAAVYGVTQSRAQLKRLSSSSSRKVLGILSLKFFPLCILVLWSVVYCKLFCFFYDPNWPVYKCYLLKALISSFTYQLKNIKIP